MSSDDGTQRDDDFYLRYYVGQRGHYGHEFNEFELYPNGRLRYANNSNYHRSDKIIRKEVFVTKAVVEEFRRIVTSSDILTSAKYETWKAPQSHEPQQELEIQIGKGNPDLTTTTTKNNNNNNGQQEQEQPQPQTHVKMVCHEILSLNEIQNQAIDPEGLTKFFYLTQDLKLLAISLINIHNKIKPI